MSEIAPTPLDGSNCIQVAAESSYKHRCPIITERVGYAEELVQEF